MTDPSLYGVVELREHGLVRRFQEKPAPGRAISHLANTGIYCVEPQVLERVPRGRAFDWSRDVFPELLAQGLPLCGHPLEGYWCDIGSLSAYRRGQRDALEGAVQVRAKAAELRPGVWAGPHVWIAPTAMLQGPVLLGAGCRIESGAVLLPGSIIGKGTTVRTGAWISNAVIGTRCQIGTGAVVEDCIIADDVAVGATCSVTGGAVIGAGCCLAAGVRINQERRVEPHQSLSQTQQLAPLSLDRHVPRGGRDRAGEPVNGAFVEEPELASALGSLTPPVRR